MAFGSGAPTATGRLRSWPRVLLPVIASSTYVCSPFSLFLDVISLFWNLLSRFHSLRSLFRGIFRSTLCFCLLEIFVAHPFAVLSTSDLADRQSLVSLPIWTKPDCVFGEGYIQQRICGLL